MADVALEIPLAALALARSGEGGDPADPRVEALGDAVDDAALAGGIAPLEQDHDLELVGVDPVLEPDQLVLEAQELAEVEPAVEARGGALRRRHQPGEAFLLDLELQFLVVGLGDLAPQRLDRGRLLRCLELAHDRLRPSGSSRPALQQRSVTGVRSVRGATARRRGRIGQRRVADPAVPEVRSPVPLREVVPVVSDFISWPGA